MLQKLKILEKPLLGGSEIFILVCKGGELYCWWGGGGDFVGEGSRNFELKDKIA